MFQPPRLDGFTHTRCLQTQGYISNGWTFSREERNASPYQKPMWLRGHEDVAMLETTDASKLRSKTDNPCIYCMGSVFSHSLVETLASNSMTTSDSLKTLCAKQTYQSCARHFNEHSFLAWNVFDVDTLVLPDTLHTLLPQLGSNTCTTLRWALS